MKRLGGLMVLLLLFCCYGRLYAQGAGNALEFDSVDDCASVVERPAKRSVSRSNMHAPLVWTIGRPEYSGCGSARSERACGTATTCVRG